MKKPQFLLDMLKQMRAQNAPSVDGSYILLCHLRSEQYARVAHPATTPAQIEAEVRAKTKAPYVYFIRDESLPAPYWLSPFRHAIRKIEVKRNDSDEKVSVSVPHVVFDVARSRDARREDSVEVAIPVPVLRSKKNDEGQAYILEQLRAAIAALLTPEPAAVA